VKDCYVAALSRAGSLAGIVVLDVVVGSDGVPSIEGTTSSVEDAELVGCVKAAALAEARSHAYPGIGRASARVTYVVDRP
jgi:hypothetical protein